MGEGNVPAALPGVDDGSSSLAASRVGEGKVRVELPGNDSGIGKSGIAGAQETDNVGSEGTGAGNGSGQIGRAGHKKAGSPDAPADNIGREGISIGGPEKVEEAIGAGKICCEGIGRAGRKKAGSPDAADDNIGRECISIGGREKVEEAIGSGKICCEGIGRAGRKKAGSPDAAGVNIGREGIGTNVVLRRQKNVTDGSVGGSSSIVVQVGDRTNWKRAVSRSTFLSTTSRNTAQIWSSNILSASGF
jgi:hypothetical protein